MHKPGQYTTKEYTPEILVEDLLSGKFQRGTGSLITTKGGEDEYCCLGVAGYQCGLFQYVENQASTYLWYSAEGPISSTYGIHWLPIHHQRNLGSLNDEYEKVDGIWGVEGPVITYIRECIIGGNEPPNTPNSASDFDSSGLALWAENHGF